MTLKVKFSDFTIITRSRSMLATVDGREALEAVSLALLQAEMPVRRSVRLLGVSLSSLTAPPDGQPQMTFRRLRTEGDDHEGSGGLVHRADGRRAPRCRATVREIKAIVEASGLSATMHANSTSIEGELVDICRLAERCEDALAAMGVQRTFFTLIFSTRRDKEQTLADKMAAVS